MTTSTLTSLLLLTLVAALAPLLVDACRSLIMLPVVVAEIAFGVLLGPDVLGWVSEDGLVALLANLGLAMLMFFAGYEIDFARMRGGSAGLALRVWVLSLVIGLGIGAMLHLAGLPDSGLVIGLALTTTALGALVPILKDTGDLRSSFGGHVLATGAVGEFGPIIAISLLLSTRAPGWTAALLLAFAAVAVLAVVMARRPRPARLNRVVAMTLRTSAQMAVRFTLLVIVALVWLADEFGLDVLLGAFTAGVVIRLFLSSGEREETALVTDKLEAVGFGFLIPMFFVVSGVRFDLSGLLGSAFALALMPALLGLFMITRGLPVAIVYRSALGRADRVALALFASTALPLVVVIVNIGVQSGRLREDLGASLVGAAMLSLVVLPLLALRARRNSRSAGLPTAG